MKNNEDLKLALKRTQNLLIYESVVLSNLVKKFSKRKSMVECAIKILELKENCLRIKLILYCRKDK